MVAGAGLGGVFAWAGDAPLVKGAGVGAAGGAVSRALLVGVFAASDSGTDDEPAPGESPTER
jgi:hypothetical protein